jgi:FtsP/CotA-like multicopper oxidase with cupredoxin domain
MDRRNFLLTAGAMATGAASNLVILTSLQASSKADHTIRIAPVSYEIAKGKTIKTVGYNGQVPGPLLRMKEGKPVTIDIFNDTDTPELVHWHGMFISTKADGAAARLYQGDRERLAGIAGRPKTRVVVHHY